MNSWIRWAETTYFFHIFYFTLWNVLSLPSLHSAVFSFVLTSHPLPLWLYLCHHTWPYADSIFCYDNHVFFLCEGAIIYAWCATGEHGVQSRHVCFQYVISPHCPWFDLMHIKMCAVARQTGCHKSFPPSVVELLQLLSKKKQEEKRKQHAELYKILKWSVFVGRDVVTQLCGIWEAAVCVLLDCRAGYWFELEDSICRLWQKWNIICITSRFH